MGYDGENVSVLEECQALLRCETYSGVGERCVGGSVREILFHEFFAALPDQADDEGGPAGLVGGSEAFAGFSVEILVEEDEVLPVWIVRVALGCLAVAVARAVAILVFFEE